MKKNLILIISVLSIFYSCNHKEKDNPYKRLSRTIGRKMITQMKSNGLKFTSDSLDVNNNLKLENKLNQHKIIFRFTQGSCGICIDSILLNLNRFTKRHNLKDKVLLLVSLPSDRDVYLFKRERKIEYDIVNIRSESINLPIDDQQVPYIFITDYNRLSKSLFIPIKEYPVLTREYLFPPLPLVCD